MTRTAVVLFNLGGPDSEEAVRPFLFNLFNDPAIIDLPKSPRWLLAKFISWRRKAKARNIYGLLGGKSPLLENTQAQARALEEKLKDKGDWRVFACMRYWHPMSGEVAKAVNACHPDHVLLLPLYPQFSTATAGSSFAAWDEAAKAEEIDAPTTRICCYPVEKNFIAAHANLIKDAYWKASEVGKPRILFSAHGLPEKTILAGDPYAWQVQKTAAAIERVLAIDDLDSVVCYQSRVGPLEWTGPYTDDEIKRAGKDGVPIVVVPISFVSEHSETLYELDILYKKLAEKHKVPAYVRVPALATDPLFIDALADLCLSYKPEETIRSFNGERHCPLAFSKCACRAAAAEEFQETEYAA